MNPRLLEKGPLILLVEESHQRGHVITNGPKLKQDELQSVWGQIRSKRGYDCKATELRVADATLFRRRDVVMVCGTGELFLVKRRDEAKNIISVIRKSNVRIPPNADLRIVGGNGSVDMLDRMWGSL